MNKNGCSIRISSCFDSFSYFPMLILVNILTQRTAARTNIFTKIGMLLILETDAGSSFTSYILGTD